MSRKLKILIAEPDDFNEDVVSRLSEANDVTLSHLTQEKLQNAFNEYDVIWLRLGFIVDETVLKGNIRCKFIVTPVTGIDHINETLCEELGIKIFSLKGEVDFLKEIRATAELTIGLTIALMRNLIPACNSTLEGYWNRDGFRGNELFEKNVGIVGMGRLGSIVAGYYNAFGCNVMGFDTRDDFPEGVVNCDSLENLIKNSDIVSIHANYHEGTKNLIGAKEFQYFKKDAVLINTARGGVLDEEALLGALKMKLIKGAALDVVKEESSFNSDNLLVRYASQNNNLLLSPHIGGNTYESFSKTETFLSERLLDEINSI